MKHGEHSIPSVLRTGQSCMQLCWTLPLHESFAHTGVVQVQVLGGAVSPQKSPYWQKAQLVMTGTWEPQGFPLVCTMQSCVSTRGVPVHAPAWQVKLVHVRDLIPVESHSLAGSKPPHGPKESQTLTAPHANPLLAGALTQFPVAASQTP
jgi:hypothetical protein